MSQNSLYSEADAIIDEINENDDHDEFENDLHSGPARLLIRLYTD